MKSSKKRIAVSILTVFMMVFTVIPYMGAVNAYADTDKNIVENTASIECPISQVEFVANDDKSYNVNVTVDMDVYPTGDLGFAESYQLNIYNNDTNAVKTYVCGPFDMYQLDVNGCIKYENVISNSSKMIAAGESVRIEFILCEDAMGDTPLGWYQWTSCFATAPAWNEGGADEPEKPVFTPDSDFELNILTDAKNYTGDGLVFEKTFKADETKYLRAVGKWYWTSMSDDSNYRSEVYDSAGNKIEGVPEDYDEMIMWKFPKADTYTFKVYSGNPYGKQMVYNVIMEFGTLHVYTYKFDPFTAEVRDMNAGTVYSPQYYVTVKASIYDGDDTLDYAVYRQDLATGQFTKPYLWSNIDDRSVDYDRGYKYFAVNKNRLSSGLLNELPKSHEEHVYMTEASIQELIYTASVAEAVIPAPEIGTISITKKVNGIKKATLNWMCSGNITSCEVQKSVNGGAYKTVAKYTAQNYILNKAYVIPYDQKTVTKFRVVPIYKYNGKEYRGKPSNVVSCTSAKVQPASGNITKLSTSKARVYAIKATGAYSTQVQYKLPGKSWTNAKWVTSKATGSKYTKTVAVKNAGKATYRFRSVIKDNGKTYYSAWKEYKPLANQRVYTTNTLKYWRNYDLGQPGPFKVYYQPSKVYYSGSNIKVTGKFFNTSSVNTRTCKVTITFKDDTGKKIATKTISCKVSPYTTKTQTFTLATKKDVNLRNITYSFTYKAQ